ncbi:GntR family transcriptional regulator [Corynebacterium endometrii]|uniref:HTH-type transcriptional repressor YtrA n=1 Tax=Corynebacterium endometrii TaxID=2488819 RepID=A0A4P7QG71_9CORY|nr:GntR family transcriptional regulator [Corynebacterium endometrii]QCB28715.1 HTH-type transcriptional repressor YtrA [Corynebacterium endometrii]
MLIILDPADNSPLYSQIVRQVIQQISAGTIRPGDRLPTAVELAETLNLNRNTVLQAYRQLRDEGWLELRRGRGTIARNPLDEPRYSRLDSLIAELTRLAQAEGISLREVTDALRKKGLA